MNRVWLYIILTILVLVLFLVISDVARVYNQYIWANRIRAHDLVLIDIKNYMKRQGHLPDKLSDVYTQGIPTSIEGVYEYRIITVDGLRYGFVIACGKNNRYSITNNQLVDVIKHNRMVTKNRHVTIIMIKEPLKKVSFGDFGIHFYASGSILPRSITIIFSSLEQESAWKYPIGL